MSDKQDSKALLGLELLLRLLLGYDHCCDSCTELEMKGYMQIEDQSTQGSDKWNFLYMCMYIKIHVNKIVLDVELRICLSYI